MNTYNLDYFIAKFEAIPEEKWLTGDFVSGEKCCALGHCGARRNVITEEANALMRLIGPVAVINDGVFTAFNQHTPKQRILAALRDRK